MTSAIYERDEIAKDNTGHYFRTGIYYTYMISMETNYHTGIDYIKVEKIPHSHNIPFMAFDPDDYFCRVFRFKHDYEFVYKVQKTQIKGKSIESIIDHFLDDTWTHTLPGMIDEIIEKDYGLNEEVLHKRKTA